LHAAVAPTATPTHSPRAISPPASESTTAATGLVAGRSCANAGQAVAAHRNAAMTGIDRRGIFLFPHLRGQARKRLNTSRRRTLLSAMFASLRKCGLIAPGAIL
jgi:hypothetical protein